MAEMSLSDSPSCLIHFEGKSGELCKLTTYTLVKIKEYCNKWVNLDGEQKEIASKLVNVVRQWPDIEQELMPTGTGDLYYHKESTCGFVTRARSQGPNSNKQDQGKKLCDREREAKRSSQRTRRAFTTYALISSDSVHNFRYRFCRKTQSSCNARIMHYM